MISENINLDKSISEPLYIQLSDSLISQIREGLISNGERLPSRRTFAEELKVSENTVMLAYQTLVDRGYAHSMPRSGLYAQSLSPINTDYSEISWENRDDHVYNLSQNLTALSYLPKSAISASLKEIIYNEDIDIFNHGEKRGDKSFRQAISKHLLASRGLHCKPSQIIIGAGTDYLLSTLCRVLGNDCACGIENPCYARSYSALMQASRNLVFINSGIGGFNLSSLKNTNINLLYTMPSHQFPLAYQMKKSTREALIKWAKAGNRYIIEDDYDSEFMYEPQEPSLFELSGGENVIYMNSFARSIAPAFKIAYMVLPENLLKIWRDTLPYYYCFASRLEQAMLAELINSRRFSKNIKELRRAYNRRRNILIEEFSAPDCKNKYKISGAGGGTHLLLTFNTEKDENEIREEADKLGIKIMPLSVCLLRPTPCLPAKTFIIGFGKVNEDELRDAIKRIKSI